MGQKNRDRIVALLRAVRSDREYAKLTEEYEKLYEQFETLAGRYPEEEQDILWAFVCVSEQMNWRMLEWLCDQYGIEG